MGASSHLSRSYDSHPIYSAIIFAMKAFQNWTSTRDVIQKHDLLKSSRVAEFISDEEGNQRIAKEIETLKSKLSDQKQSLRDALLILAKTGLWQLDQEWVPPSHTPSAVDAQRDEELISQVSGLKAAVTELHSAAAQLGSRLNVPISPLSNSKSSSSASTTTASYDNAMVVDADPRSHSKKRRRLSTDANDWGVPAGAMTLREVQGLAQRLEAQLASFETQLTEKAAATRAQIKHELDIQVATLKEEVAAHISSVEQETEAQWIKKVDSLEVEIIRDGNDIQEIVKEVADLIATTNELENEFKDLKAENVQLKHANEQLREEVEYWKNKANAVRSDSIYKSFLS